MTNSQSIEDTITTARSNNASYNAAGTMIHTSARVINGHMVEVRVTGWSFDTATTVVFVDRSSEPLTVAEATQRISA